MTARGNKYSYIKLIQESLTHHSIKWVVHFHCEMLQEPQVPWITVKICVFLPKNGAENTIELAYFQATCCSLLDPRQFMKNIWRFGDKLVLGHIDSL